MSSWNEGKYHEASFAIHKSRRYHLKMRGFYLLCHDAVCAVGAVAGTGVWVVLSSTSQVTVMAQALAAIVAIASILNLVFRFWRKAEMHGEFAGQYTELAAKLEVWPADERHLHWARVRRLKIEKDEPSERRLVNLVSYNEEARLRGARNEDLVPLSSLQIWLGYVATFGLRRLERWHNERHRQGTLYNAGPTG